MQKKSQTSDELVIQLQENVILTEKEVVDILAFQTQSLEVHKELESTQRSLFNKVEAIQNHFQVVNQALDNICLKEREVIAARTNFQEAVVSSAREGVSMVSRFSVSEQIRGNIILTAWETNIPESKRMAKEVKEAYEEAFHSLDQELLGLDKDSIFEVLGQVDIAKHQLNIKTNMEEAHAEILQLKQIDITQINRWLVKPSLQL
jgi:hypothetical protein